MPRVKTPSPPTPPPKVEIERPTEDESKQKGKEITSIYDSGSLANATNMRTVSPIPPPSDPVKAPSLPLATEENSEVPVLPPAQEQKQGDTEKEAVDFSTEKIAVNLDLHGPSARGSGAEENEDDYVMSPTAYPGQAWEPSYYGWT
jgi:hypothetical protein